MDASHPTDRSLSAYALGKLDGASTKAVEQHLERCPDCRRRVAELSSDSFLDRVRDAQQAAGQSQLGASPAARPVTVPPLVESLPPGLADHPDYEIKSELGRGGMGVVYLAHNTLMGRDEVLKVMSKHLMDRPGVLDRFLREIRAVARLRHPNIVTAYSATRIGESIVFAMEYVEGLDLSKIVKAKGPLPVSHACNFVYQAALGLQHAYEEGLVHRDIKPANLMLSRKGDRAAVKVLDFGLAKVAREEHVDGGLTSQGQALGTPDFIAPEQILNAQDVDIRADIYSVGGTLFYLLTGRPPFQANSLYDIYQAHISREADPLNVVRPDVPAELAALVAKMMWKDPAARFQTPGELAEALTPFFKKGNTASRAPRTDHSLDGSVYSSPPLPRSVPDQPRLPRAPGVSGGKPAERQRGDSVATQNSAPIELPLQFGRYRVKKRLGGGGMGTVYLVENTELEREEALKVPNFRDSDDPQLRARFLREAKSAAKLDHPNLCPIYDAGVQDGIYYLTMRYLKGRLLSDYTGEPQPERKVVEIVAKLALALEAAHAREVIHRDLKPTNIMMVTGVGPVVMDFGLAKQVQQADAKLTQAGSMLGTPAYMPPEQVNGDLDQMGPASDIYSLGVILYELLTGRLPFEGPTATLVGQILHTDPPAPSALVPGLSPVLDVICRTAMAKASKDRYPSMKAFAAVLVDFVRSTPATGGANSLVPSTEYRTANSQPPTVADPLPAHTAAVQATTLAPGPLDGGTPSQRAKKPTPFTTEWPPMPARSWVGSNPMIVLGIASALISIAIVFFAVATVRVRTADGDLVIEVNEPYPDVYVDGQKVTAVWQQGGLKAVVGVKTGTHQVEIKKDGFSAAGQKVTVSDGERELLTAALIRPTPGERLAKADVREPPASDAPQAASEAPKENPVESAPQPVPADPPPAARKVVHAAPPPQALDCTGPNGASADVVRQAQAAWAKYLDRNVETTVEVAKGVKMKFVLVPPGRFHMGSPVDEIGRADNETLHVVTLTEPFDMGKFEVTQAQYAAVTGLRPSQFKGDNRPVEVVSWKDATAFARALTERRSDGYVYRLATEAEWEYACRGGRASSLRFGVGDGRMLGPRDGNFNNHLNRTSPVGAYPSNALGLHDMHGNVWEWCADWNEPYPNGAVTNPFRATGSPFRVARGGCHNEPANTCRSALRQGSGEDRRDCWMGFRLARSIARAGD